MATEVQTERRLTHKQYYQALKILHDPVKTRILFDGGTRSGKTFIILLFLIGEMGRYPGARILAARKHRDHAKATLWDLSLKQMCARMPRYHFQESSPMTMTDLATGSKLMVNGLDNDQRVDKVLGDEFLHVFINEGNQVTYSVLQTVLSRLAQPIDGYPDVPHKLILDCNPKGQRHWLHRIGIENVHPESLEPLPDAGAWARLHWTPFDNPYLPADYRATLDAMTGVQRRRMRDGIWCDNEGAVYDEFDEDIHVIHEMPKGWESWRWYRAVDFGYTNPFVCLWAAEDSDGRLYVWAERYVRRMLVSEHAKAITAVREGEPRLTVADHDAEDRATLHAAKIHTVAARKDVRRGIQRVKDRLKVQPDGRPRLFIHESCTHTLGEFQDYCWPEGKDGKAEDEAPIKDNDHAMDAIRYLVMQIDDRAGGFAPVTWSFSGSGVG